MATSQEKESDTLEFLFPRRGKVGRLPVDCLTQTEVLKQIEQLVDRRNGGYIVTPNVDHIVIAEYDEEFLKAYEQASLSLVDGMPVLFAARCLGFSIPEKVSGSDLIEPLLADANEKKWRVFLLGGAPGVAEKAHRRIQQRWPELRVVGTASPWIDLANPAESDDSLIRQIHAADVQILIVGFGAPKQEIWMYRNQRRLGAVVALGLGASIDFLAGNLTRAPRWISDIGLEWAYRLLHEPRRLFRRYLLRDPAFFAIILRQLLSMRRG